MNIPLRELDRSDVAAVARLHLDSFPTFFLSSLGLRFLEFFYSAFLEDDSAVAIVALDSERGRVIGVVVGTIEPSGFFSRLVRRRWWAFCVAAASAVVRRPSILPRLIRALRYRGAAPPGHDRALLSSIAVSPNHQGRGVGHRLLQAWTERVRFMRVSGCYLTTDAQNNESTNDFYRSAGWKLESTIVTPEARRMNRYVLDF